MSQISCDLCIIAKWIVPVTELEGPLKVLTDSCIGVNNGKIMYVGSTADFNAKYSAKETVNKGGDSIIMPGMVNLHCHMGMHLMKGKYDDYLLHDWLQRIWPTENYFLSDAERKSRWCHLGSLLASYESLLEGVTTVNDMYFSPTDCHNAADKAGLRVISGNGILDFKDGNIDASMAQEHADLTNGISPILCLHGLYTSTKEVHNRFKAWRQEFPKLRFHVHVNETREEREMQTKMYGADMPVIAKLDEMGCLDDRLIAAHMVHMTDEEIVLCGKRGVNCAHCPRSNLKLASGLLKTKAMINAGMTIGLGTDSAVSNNQLSILDEMAAAAFVGKVSAQKPDAVTVHDAIRMGTINGAKALGLDNSIGSIEVDKECDLTIVDLTPGNHFFPITNEPLSHLIYTSRRSVCDVFRGGNHVVKDGKVTTFELDREDMIRLMTELDGQIVMNEGKLMKLQT